MRHVRFLAVLAIVAALLVLPATTLSAPATTAMTSYTVTDLGDLGGKRSIAISINNLGQVVGFSNTTQPDPSAPPHNPPFTRVHAFLWHNGKMRDLGTDGTHPDSLGDGINDRSQVAGSFGNYFYHIQRAFLWERGEFTALPTLGGPYSHAYSINASTQIAGGADLNAFDPSGGSLDGYQQHAVIWSASGKVQDLGTLGGLDSDIGSGYAINVHGHMAGVAQYNTTYNPVAQQYNYHAFLWDGSQMIDLGALGQQTNDSISFGTAVNNADTVVGLSFTDVPDTCFGGPQNWGFLWQAGSMQPLPPFSGDCNALAYAINSSGQIVGFSLGGTSSALVERAVIWSGGMAVDLNTLIPASSGWSLLQAVGINEHGQIVGFGINPAGKVHGFLLAPTSSTASPTARATVAPLTRQQIEDTALIFPSGYSGKLGGPLKI